MNKPRGRPPGRSDTRSALLNAARARFLSQGYAGTSMRAVARDVGVDHSLVNYHFGSKQGLFTEVMALNLSPGRVLDVVETTGGQRIAERVLAGLLTVWDEPAHRAPLIAMMTEAGSSPAVRRAVTGYLEREVYARVADLTGPHGGRDQTERTAAAAAILGGVVYTRYVLCLEPIASMSPQQVVTILGPALRATLGPTPTLAQS